MYDRFAVPYGGNVLVYDDTNASPLNANGMNVLLCIVGGIVIGTGLGAISNQVLKKTSLV